MVGEFQMKSLFDGEQDDCGYPERKLPLLHAEFLRLNRDLPPLRRWPLAQSADLQNRDQIQQCSYESEQDHRNTNPVGVETVNECGCFGGERQGSNADYEPHSRHRHEERADAL